MRPGLRRLPRFKAKRRRKLDQGLVLWIQFEMSTPPVSGLVDDDDVLHRSLDALTVAWRRRAWPDRPFEEAVVDDEQPNRSPTDARPARPGRGDVGGASPEGGVAAPEQTVGEEELRASRNLVLAEPNRRRYCQRISELVGISTKVAAPAPQSPTGSIQSEGRFDRRPRDPDRIPKLRLR